MLGTDNGKRLCKRPCEPCAGAPAPGAGDKPPLRHRDVMADVKTCLPQPRRPSAHKDRYVKLMRLAWRCRRAYEPVSVWLYSTVPATRKCEAGVVP